MSTGDPCYSNANLYIICKYMIDLIDHFAVEHHGVASKDLLDVVDRDGVQAQF